MAGTPASIYIYIYIYIYILIYKKCITYIINYIIALYKFIVKGVATINMYHLYYIIHDKDIHDRYKSI